ncbi:unnamed protein product [Rotaria sordida]|uniref:Snake toxin/toxin-like domain-containing protein n=1 Tax=Rotaria sordida TaxID=392033 RepID=A0A813YW18_9BILA|nr:unnamed protein product [Rotaria sordida]
MKSMGRILPIVLILLAFSFSITHAALTCYSCNDCGTSWDASKATIVQTSGANDYCRKTVTGSSVSKDFSSSCTPVNVLGNGVFCCQSDLCNSANKRSITMIHLEISMGFIWIIYHYWY